METQLRAMAKSSSTVSCKALLLLSIISASSGFNIKTNSNGSGNRVRRMPPLFYTDIEPEIRSITVPPPVIDFNEANSNLHKTDNDAHDESDILTKEKNSSRRRTPSKRTKNKSKTTTTATDASPSSNNKGKKTHDSVWHRHYADLQQYKEKYGNCLVPQNYADNRKLGLWVMQQRRQYTLLQQGKNSSLSGKRGDYRLQLLEDIGFVWRLDRRGPRGSYGVLRKTSDQVEHETHTVANFEQYMLEKCSDYTDDEKRDVWLKRFEILR